MTAHDGGQLSWIKDGGLVEEELKAVVSALAMKLASSCLDVQREGATAFLSLINSTWSLETHVARDSADLIAMEIRYSNYDLSIDYRDYVYVSSSIIYDLSIALTCRRKSCENFCSNEIFL